LLIIGLCNNQDVDVLRTDVNRLLRLVRGQSDIDSLKDKTAGAAKEEAFNVVRMSQGRNAVTVIDGSG